MYLRNAWYVAAWSRDIVDRPVARRMLDEPVVVFRTSDGTVVALEDRCPHRHLPLSMGQCVGQAIQCGYHGMVFDAGGQCIEVPSQGFVPPTARVRAYPAVERYGWVWVWMGEADRADPALIPDFHHLTDPGYAAVGKTNHVSAAYTLVTDNLLDLSHVGYVHTTTIGNAAFTEKGRLTHRRTDRGVVVSRFSPDVPPPPTYIKTGVLPIGKNIDRWQHIEFIAPCFVLIHVGGAEAGTGALDGRYDHGLNIWVINAMTPETATTTNYLWASARRHAIGDADADALFFNQVSEAFEEDRRVLEAQQAVLLTRDDSWAVALKADAGAIEARRMLERMIAREAAGEDLATSAVA